MCESKKTKDTSQNSQEHFIYFSLLSFRKMARIKQLAIISTEAKAARRQVATKAVLKAPPAKKKRIRTVFAPARSLCAKFGSFRSQPSYSSGRRLSREPCSRLRRSTRRSFVPRLGPLRRSSTRRRSFLPGCMKKCSSDLFMSSELLSCPKIFSLSTV